MAAATSARMTGRMTEKQVIRTGVPETGGPINIAVRRGDMVYISGLPPFTPEFSEAIQAARREGRPLPAYPDIPFDRQVRIVMDSMKTIMESVGSSMHSGATPAGPSQSGAPCAPGAGRPKNARTAWQRATRMKRAFALLLFGPRARLVARASIRLLAMLFGGVSALPALADTWPEKPIHIVVPFTAGSATDVVARAMTDRLAAELGQPIVVDNRPGAGGTIGAAIVAKAEPDGYTLLVQSASHTVTPTTYPNLPYDTVRDLKPVIPLAVQPNVLVVSPMLGIKTVQELIARAKAHPGTLNYASAGAGSATQLNAERFRLAAGFEAVHVPFKGTPEALTEVLTGRVDYYFCPVVAALTQIQEGKLVALAVGSPKRSSVLPNVPTTLEAGVPDSDYNFWVGMFAPARTPPEIIAKLYREAKSALDSPEVRDRYAKLGADPFPMTPQQFELYIRNEIAANARLIKAANITTQ